MVSKSVLASAVLYTLSIIPPVVQHGGRFGGDLLVRFVFYGGIPVIASFFTWILLVINHFESENKIVRVATQAATVSVGVFLAYMNYVEMSWLRYMIQNDKLPADQAYLKKQRPYVIVYLGCAILLLLVPISGVLIELYFQHNGEK